MTRARLVSQLVELVISPPSYVAFRVKSKSVVATAGDLDDILQTANRDRRVFHLEPFPSFIVAKCFVSFKILSWQLLVQTET